jgi:ribose transport system substrate-binding protein
MSMRTGDPTRRRLLTAVAVSVMALSMSGAVTAQEDGLQAAQALVEQHAVPQDAWQGPDSAPPPAEGRTVGIIPCALFIEGCARLARGAEEAATAIGWEPIVVDGEANPQSIQEAMDSLINRDVDAIILAAVNYQDIGAQVEQAVANDIAVMATFASDPAEVGGLGEVGIDDFEAGRTLAAYAVTEGGGGAVIFTQNESPAVAERAEGFKAGYAEFGGEDDAVVAEQSVSNSQLGAPQEPIMAGILQQNPAGAISWVFAGFDFMLTPLVNVIDREGRTEIRGFSFDGNLENLQFIRDGRVQSAVIGYPLEWAGWAAIDQLNRAFNDEPLVEDTGVRFKLLTADSLPPEGEAFTGDLDFRAQYLGLWGR